MVMVLKTIVLDKDEIIDILAEHYEVDLSDVEITSSVDPYYGTETIRAKINIGEIEDEEDEEI